MGVETRRKNGTDRLKERGVNTVDFNIYYDNTTRFAEMEDVLWHLKDLGVPEASQPVETGVALLLISMPKNDVVIFEDDKRNKIKVERVR